MNKEIFGIRVKAWLDTLIICILCFIISAYPMIALGILVVGCFCVVLFIGAFSLDNLMKIKEEKK